MTRMICCTESAGEFSKKWKKVSNDRVKCCFVTVDHEEILTNQINKHNKPTQLVNQRLYGTIPELFFMDNKGSLIFYFPK